jgi:hypothetical protein
VVRRKVGVSEGPLAGVPKLPSAGIIRFRFQGCFSARLAVDAGGHP